MRRKLLGCRTNSTVRSSSADNSSEVDGLHVTPSSIKEELQLRAEKFGQSSIDA